MEESATDLPHKSNLFRHKTLQLIVYSPQLRERERLAELIIYIAHLNEKKKSLMRQKIKQRGSFDWQEKIS